MFVPYDPTRLSPIETLGSKLGSLID